MTDRIDFMFAEVDRQLAEVREHSTAVATRVGLLISASAIGATVLVANFESVKTGEILAFVALGVATSAGIGALVPGLEPGPEPYKISRWAVDLPEDQQVTALFDAKVGMLEANRERLANMTRWFYLQVGAVIVAVAIALGAAIGRG